MTVCLFSECKGFEDDWKQRDIEITGERSNPVRYGTVITIKCGTGYMTLPDTVTCIENTNFYGSDDVECSSEYMTTFSLGG